VISVDNRYSSLIPFFFTALRIVIPSEERDLLFSLWWEAYPQSAPSSE
jgi:hypothetical protein